jgi:hypothetical protein
VGRHHSDLGLLKVVPFERGKNLLSVYHDISPVECCPSVDASDMGW